MVASVSDWFLGYSHQTLFRAAMVVYIATVLAIKMLHTVAVLTALVSKVAVAVTCWTDCGLMPEYGPG